MNGKTPTLHSLETASLQFLNWLESEFPKRRGDRVEALLQIRSDMMLTWRALSYGGRAQTQIPPERRESLRRDALQFGWL